ncbi:hypothetical protein J3S85_31025 [Streptomyces lavenduligriseus]|nr:hypothetical protein J3S85_31025 [Streptomyces lavenduligriseus]
MSSFGQLFSEIEAAVYRHWDRSAEDHLSEAATRALSAHPELLDFDSADCLQWAIRDHSALPVQSWDFDFGQPAITVVRNKDFRVDLLYWLENASSIHDHITCGAFAAVLGDRLHGVYRFEVAEDLGPWVQRGKLERTTLEIMGEGDVRPIRPDLIHDLFWLGKPSVTLVVRCAEHPSHIGKPRNYLSPGLAYVGKSHHHSSLVSRRAEALDLIRQADDEMYKDSLLSVLRGEDPSLAFFAFAGAALNSPGVLDASLDELQSDDAPFLDLLVRTRRHIVRRSYFAGVYSAGEVSRLPIGLLWAEASTEDAHRLIDAAFPDEHPTTILKAAADELEDLAPEAAEQLRALVPGQFRPNEKAVQYGT